MQLLNDHAVLLAMQVCPYGLYTEQISGTAFTAPRRQVTFQLKLQDVWRMAVEFQRILLEFQAHKAVISEGQVASTG